MVLMGNQFYVCTRLAPFPVPSFKRKKSRISYINIASGRLQAGLGDKKSFNSACYKVIAEKMLVENSSNENCITT